LPPRLHNSQSSRRRHSQQLVQNSQLQLPARMTAAAEVVTRQLQRPTLRGQARTVRALHRKNGSSSNNLTISQQEENHSTIRGARHLRGRTKTGKLQRVATGQKFRQRRAMSHHQPTLRKLPQWDSRIRTEGD